MNSAQYMLSDAAHCYPRLFDAVIMGEIRIPKPLMPPTIQCISIPKIPVMFDNNHN